MGKFKEAFDNIHMPKMPKFSFLKKKTDTEEEKEEASDAVAVVTKDKNDVKVEEKSEAIANKQDANTIDTKATAEEEAIVEGETEVVAQDAESIDTKSIVEEEAIQVSGAGELQDAPNPNSSETILEDDKSNAATDIIDDLSKTTPENVDEDSQSAIKKGSDVEQKQVEIKNIPDRKIEEMNEGKCSLISALQLLEDIDSCYIPTKSALQLLAEI